ncbi:GbsR/MarR family transcriptional regulator [Salegentibacter chungangensis]|uniref:GbsR/MarR family transcriptional regulator n=1 Tax=Salegentibacter chungangensis TaxID=1335724 RepID=A0ABW3NPF7_9FLAO
MSKPKNLKSRKEELIERLGVYKENEEQLAPLAARILATLILTGRKGVTFEGLVTDLKASKSTICTHLNTLQASGRVSYFTKPGDRKRYFIVSPNHLIQIMDEMMEKWSAQKQIHQDILDYKTAANQEIDQEEESKFDLEFHKDYLEFLGEAGKSIKKLKEKIINKHLQDE